MAGGPSERAAGKAPDRAGQLKELHRELSGTPAPSTPVPTQSAQTSSTRPIPVEVVRHSPRKFADFSAQSQESEQEKDEEHPVSQVA